MQEANQTGVESPTRRNRGQPVENLSPRKPNVREVAAPARFGGLHNGFAATPQLRQSTSAQGRHPASSLKGAGNDDVEPNLGSPPQMDRDAFIGDDAREGGDEHLHVSISSIKVVVAHGIARLSRLQLPWDSARARGLLDRITTQSPASIPA